MQGLNPSTAGRLSGELAALWDELMVQASASPFQSSGFCNLLDDAWPGSRDSRHIVIRSEDKLIAAVPAYLYGTCARLDYYRKSLGPDPFADPILLSHSLVGWHGYPVASRCRDRDLAIERFVAEAGREDAVAMFAGIPAHHQDLVDSLGRFGFELAVFHTAMVRDLTSFCGEDSTKGLPRKKRARVRNDLARARRAGTRIRPATVADRPAIVQLLACVLERKNTPQEVMPDRFVTRCLESPPPGLEVFVAVDAEERPIGTHLNFKWGRVYCIWLAGHAYDSLNRFRPSHALYVHSINRAKSLGCTMIEAGRDPYPIKRQHGFEPVSLLSAVRGSSPSSHRRAGAWVRFLQERHFKKYESHGILRQHPSNRH